MVKVGFIVEGDTEKILMESGTFRKWCDTNGIAVVDPVINAQGGGNLLPKYLSNHIARLSKNGTPDKIVVLTDLEREPNVTEVRNRIQTGDIDFIFVAVKAIEAWFLADSAAMSSCLGEKGFHEDFPEKTPNMPWERIKQIAREKKQRGPGASKPGFARKMTGNHGFSIERAAKHPNCPSAKEFHDTLKAWGQG